MDTWEIQAERKRNEREPVDWDTYRRALIASGHVADAWHRRHAACFGFECDTPDDCPHYKQAAGMAQSAVGMLGSCSLADYGIGLPL